MRIDPVTDTTNNTEQQWTFITQSMTYQPIMHPLSHWTENWQYTCNQCNSDADCWETWLFCENGACIIGIGHICTSDADCYWSWSYALPASEIVSRVDRYKRKTISVWTSSMTLKQEIL